MRQSTIRCIDPATGETVKMLKSEYILKYGLLGSEILHDVMDTFPSAVVYVIDQNFSLDSAYNGLPGPECTKTELKYIFRTTSNNKKVYRAVEPGGGGGGAAMSSAAASADPEKDPLAGNYEDFMAT